MSETPQPNLEHRRVRRKSVKRGTLVSCRKGALGLGPNLAIGVRDLTHEGVRLVVKELISPTTEIEVSLTAVGINKPMIKLGRVIWCNPIDIGFLIGVKFHDPLGYVDFLHLT